MKKMTFLFLLTGLFTLSFAQQNNVTVVSTSATVKMDYFPKTVISKAAIAFFRFENEYAIQVSCDVQGNHISTYYNGYTDSLVVGLVNNKPLILKRPYRDSIYMLPDGNYYWQLTYIMDNIQFQALKTQKISSLFTTHDNSMIQIKRKSQDEILDVVNSF